MDSTPATTNWTYTSERCIKMYLEAHKEDSFLVVIDRGRGGAYELDTMMGKHILLRLSVQGTSLHLPKVVAVSRIYDINLLLKEITHGTSSPRLL